MQSFRLSFHCHIDDWYPFFMILCLHYMDFNTFRGKGADPSFFSWCGVFLLRKESFIIHANSVPDLSTWWNSSNFSSYPQPSRTSVTQILIAQPTAMFKLAHYTVWASMMRFETKPLGLGGHQTEFSCFIQPPTAYLFQKRHNISACMYVPTWTMGNFYSSFLIKKVEWVLVCRFDGIYRAPDCYQSFGSSFPIDMWLKHLSLVDTVINATSDWVKTGSCCFRN